MIRALALLCTPLLVLSSAHELYLRNQGELGGHVSVLRPFWVGAAAALVATVLLARGAGRRSAAVRWASHGAGLAFLVWCVARAGGDGLFLWTTDGWWGFAAFVLVAAGLVVVAAVHVPVERVEPALAVFALVLAASETWRLATRLEAVPAAPSRPSLAPRSAAPNVYHVILDAFQDGLFEPGLPSARAGSFDGFVRFPAARSTAGATQLSLPTIVTGLHFVRPPSLAEALVHPDSVVSGFAAAGYARLAVVPRSVYPPGAGAFDVTLFHEQHAPVDAAEELDAILFRRLWATVVLPAEAWASLSGRGASDVEFRRSLHGQRLSTYTQPVQSLLSLRRATAEESSWPDRGRYTLLHVLLPHNPFLLSGDCSFEDADRPTDVLRQTTCALEATADYLDELRRLGRYDSSIIVLHGDHGAGYALRGGVLTEDASVALDTLLMVKAPGATGPLRMGEPGATLADVAPTLRALAGLPARPSDGRVLAAGAE